MSNLEATKRAMKMNNIELRKILKGVTGNNKKKKAGGNWKRRQVNARRWSATRMKGTPPKQDKAEEYEEISSEEETEERKIENERYNNYMNKKALLEKIVDLEEMMSLDINKWKMIRKYALRILEDLRDKEERSPIMEKLNILIIKIEKNAGPFRMSTKDGVLEFLDNNIKPKL